MRSVSVAVNLFMEDMETLPTLTGRFVCLNYGLDKEILQYISNKVSGWSKLAGELWLTTVFTRMQEDSNLRWHPKNKTSAKKKYFTVNFIHLIHKACQILSTSTSQCCYHHLHGWCSHLPHNPNIPIFFTAIPLHTTVSIIHCIKCIAFLKTLHNHVCYDPHLLNTTFIFIVTPCINDIKHFIIQLMHTLWKCRVIKTY